MNPIRIAIVDDGRAARVVADYLPPNYWALGRTLDTSGTVIAGRDENNHTLTLDHIMDLLRDGGHTVSELTMIKPTPAELLADDLEQKVEIASNLGEPAAAAALSRAIRELRS